MPTSWLDAEIELGRDDIRVARVEYDDASSFEDLVHTFGGRGWNVRIPVTLMARAGTPGDRLHAVRWDRLVSVQVTRFDGSRRSFWVARRSP